MEERSFSMPAWQESALEWDIEHLVALIADSEIFKCMEYGSALSIALRGLDSAYCSGQRRWHNYFQSISARLSAVDSDVDGDQVAAELMYVLLRVQQLDRVAIYESDDNDMSDARWLAALFAGLDDELQPVEARRHQSVVELVHGAVSRHYPEKIASFVRCLPESLIYAAMAMKYAGWGLYWLSHASGLVPSYPLPGIGDSTDRENGESALLFLADARVAITKMRYAEVIEAAQVGRQLPEYAAKTIFDELGIQLRANATAERVRKRKSDGGKNKDAGVNKERIIAAVNAGSLQKTVALEFGVTEARVSQIMKEHREKS